MNCLRFSALFTLGLAFLCSSSQSFAWSKAYVVDWIERAYYFDPHDKDAFSAEAPGRDCPNGVTKDPDYPKKLIDVGHAPDSVQHLYDPEVRNAPGFDRSVFGKRGKNGENVYREPWTAIDYDYPKVEGKLAYGFDLDNDPTTGYTGVDGTPGVDHRFYHVFGCVGYYRGLKRDSGDAKYRNESMHNGSYTMVLILEGSESPTNDSAATLTFTSSPDNLMRDAIGGIASDYSFRVNPDELKNNEVKVAVTIKDGVIKVTEPQDLVVRKSRADRRGRRRGGLTLHDGQLDLKMTDHGLEGLIGGYQPWEPIWRGRASYINEIVSKVDSPSIWYALKRNADGVPDPVSGEMTAISATYNLWAVPAFAITDDLSLTAVDNN